MSKFFEVSVVASATVTITKTYRAETEKQANEKFYEDLKACEGLELEERNLDYKVLEPPLEGHDWEREDFDAIETTDPAEDEKALREFREGMRPLIEAINKVKDEE